MTDHEEYKQSLIKILDIARESHWYLLDRVTARQFDIAKTYLWVSSVIGAIAMFVVKELQLSPASGILVAVSVVFASVSFLLSMTILWGKIWGESKDALTDSMGLAMFVYERFIINNDPPSSVYAGLIGSITDANSHNRATNTRRAAMLRIAAPFLMLSFLCLMTSIFMRALNV